MNGATFAAIKFDSSISSTCQVGQSDSGSAFQQTPLETRVVKIQRKWYLLDNPNFEKMTNVNLIAFPRGKTPNQGFYWPERV